MYWEPKLCEPISQDVLYILLVLSLSNNQGGRVLGLFH